MIGREVEVLVEGRSRRKGKDGRPTWFGRSPQGKVTVFPQPAEANRLVKAAVEGATSHTLLRPPAGRRRRPASRVAGILDGGGIASL